MGKFILTMEASVSAAGGSAPTLDILVDGIPVTSSSAITSITGVGSDLLVFTLDFTGSFPASLAFRFNGGSGDPGDIVSLDSVRINGHALDPGDLTGILVAQGATQSVVSTAAIDHLFARVEPTLPDLGAPTVTGTGGDDGDLRGDDVTDDVIDGGAGNDRILAFDGDDAVYGGDGADEMFGQEGNDILVGGLGMDRLSGNAGDDLLFGGDNNDILLGEDGNDVLSGGAGDDNLTGHAGDDILYGGAGNDRIMDAAGTNALFGDAGNDIIIGGINNDTIYGGADNDQINGGKGDDTLSGDGGADTLAGSAGNDTLSGGGGNDILSGAAGVDTASYENAASGATVALALGTASNDGDGGSDTLIAIENVLGSAFADNFTGDGNANTLAGGAGNDILSGAAGDDTLDGGGDNDTLSGGEGIDDIDGGAGTDTADYSGAAGDVTASLASGAATDDGDGESDNLVSIENLSGSAFDDTFAGDGNANVLSGNGGDDTISGGGGGDTLDGNAGDDFLDGEAGNDTLSGGTGGDTLNGGADNDVIYALDNGISPADADDGESNILNGDTGSDTLHGSTGTDFLSGGGGNDTLNSGAGISIADIESLYGVSYSAATGNFYQFVATNVTYATASAAAASATINGIAGHLVTITSAAENTYVDNLISDDVWIAASDAAAENTWRWIEGPESGTHFSTGATAVPGQYENWDGGEPDAQDNARMQTDGTWQDRGGGSTDAYVIEWEGIDVLATFATTMRGEDGLDTLSGNNNGVDYFTFESSSAFNNVDIINNFSTANGDAIDLLDLLNGLYIEGFHTLTNFVRITTVGANSELRVDVTGSASFGAGTLIATIMGVTGITDEVALKDNGNLIVPLVGLDIIGTPLPDVLISNATGHTIGGLASDDIIHGRGGIDTLYGMGGNDTAAYDNAAGAVTASILAGGASNDGDGASDIYNSIENLTGSAFGDNLTGDNGANVINGNGGNDSVFGLAGNDTLHGGAGTDSLDGGTGSDTAAYTNAAAGITASIAGGGAANDGDGGADNFTSIENLSGSAFNDTLTGDNNANILSGDGGNDTLTGGAGADALNGDEGNDSLYGGTGDDTLDGGNGTDTADYSTVGSGVTVDLGAGAASNDGEGGSDILSSIEIVEGSAFADDLSGGAGNDTLNGDNGDDLLYGAGGNDALNGGGGSDTATYENAASAVTASLLAGSAGNDGDGGADAFSSLENLEGSDFNDSLTGDNNANILSGGLGVDTIFGNGGNDIIYAGQSGSGLTIAEIETAYGVTYSAATGNFYLYDTSGVNYSVASADAASSLIEGVSGHLLTVTSQAENDFIENTLGIGDHVWLAASDSGTEGEWIWTEGPEAGTLFWTGGGGGSEVTYANFEPGEPDNTATDNHLRLRDDSGEWEDRNGADGQDSDDYVIEWEGGDIFGADDASANFLYGGAGDDTIYGDIGNDTIEGGDDDDTIYGEDGDDDIDGGDDDDTAYGGLGGDAIDGGDGNDTLYANANTYVALTAAFNAGGDGFAYADGGPWGGADGGGMTINGNYIAGDGNTANGSIEVDFNATGASANSSGSWSITVNLASAMDSARLSFAYRLQLDAGADGGEDIFLFADVDGTQYGTGGNAYVDVIEGNISEGTFAWQTVTLDIGALGAGNHTITLGGNYSQTSANDESGWIRFDDVVLANDGAGSDEAATNVLDGGGGNDTLYGSDGTDTLNGGDGSDILYSGSNTGFTIADALAENPNAVYDAGTGNFYELVTAGANWATASANAAASTINGAAGHLVTITSGAENTFIENLLVGTDAWLGGRDDIYGGENQWYWVEGPEDGTQFSNGAASVGGMYENWDTAAGEPNDNGPSEAFRMAAGTGLWLDNDDATVYDYVIEWEGSAVLGGGGNVTTMNGGAGADQLYGGDGEDLFVFESNGGDAFANPDTIHDFDETDNDTIDISDILDGLGVNAGNLSQFVDIAAGTGVRVDITGSGSFGAGTIIATFSGSTTVSNENVLLAGGGLII